MDWDDAIDSLTLIGGNVGATAVCNIGFWTCCDLTDCIMIGD